MADSDLPRELKLIINQIAHDRAHIAPPSGYRKAYRKEKALLLNKVVTWLTAGKTFDEVLANLQSKWPKKKAEFKAAIEALRKKVWETP